MRERDPIVVNVLYPNTVADAFKSAAEVEEACHRAEASGQNVRVIYELERS